jgi:thymidylate kinase
MDRYAHSTVAYTVAQAMPFGSPPESIRELPSRFFDWPAGLPHPRLVLLLTCGERQRRDRLVARGAQGWGATEERQAGEAALGGRIAAAYERVRAPGGTSVVHLDAGVGEDEVAAAAVRACRDAGLC